MMMMPSENGPSTSSKTGRMERLRNRTGWSGSPKTSTTRSCMSDSCRRYRKKTCRCTTLIPSTAMSKQRLKWSNRTYTRQKMQSRRFSNTSFRKRRPSSSRRHTMSTNCIQKKDVPMFRTPLPSVLMASMSRSASSATHQHRISWRSSSGRNSPITPKANRSDNYVRL